MLRLDADDSIRLWCWRVLGLSLLFLVRVCDTSGDAESRCIVTTPGLSVRHGEELGQQAELAASSCDEGFVSTACKTHDGTPLPAQRHPDDYPPLAINCRWLKVFYGVDGKFSGGGGELEIAVTGKLKECVEYKVGIRVAGARRTLYAAECTSTLAFRAPGSSAAHQDGMSDDGGIRLILSVPLLPRDARTLHILVEDGFAGVADGESLLASLNVVGVPCPPCGFRVLAEGSIVQDGDDEALLEATAPESRRGRGMHQTQDDSEKPKSETERVGGMGEPSCALLFYGLVKQFAHVVLPSIRENILAYNPSCDVYAHTYNLTSISSPRNSENDCPVLVEEVYSLTSNVVMDTISDFEHKRPNHKSFRKYHPPDDNWEYPSSIDNLIKAWHSENSVWDLMEASGNKYDRVGIFRLDTRFPHPISVNDGRPGVACSHRLAWGGLCDRAFYGNYDVVKQYASEKFARAHEYAEEHGDLHSERFVRYLMRGFNIVAEEICVHRVRACAPDGSICSAPAHTCGPESGVHTNDC